MVNDTKGSMVGNTNVKQQLGTRYIYNVSVRLEKWNDRLFRSAGFVNEACFVTPRMFSNPVNFKQMLEGKEPIAFIRHKQSINRR